MEGKLGITKHAADMLGDIVYVDLPGEGDSFSKDDSIVSFTGLACFTLTLMNI